MKVSELLTEAPLVAANKALGFIKDKKIPLGTGKEWQKTVGAGKEEVKKALEVVRQSPEYKAMLATGMKDTSSPRQTALGSITFTGRSLPDPKSGKSQRVMYTVGSQGQVQTTSPWGYRGPVGTGKPRIVPNDPVGSISKTMIAAVKKITQNASKRVQKGPTHTATTSVR